MTRERLSGANHIMCVIFVSTKTSCFPSLFRGWGGGGGGVITYKPKYSTFKAVKRPAFRHCFRGGGEVMASKTKYSTFKAVNMLNL